MSWRLCGVMELNGETDGGAQAITDSFCRWFLAHSPEKTSWDLSDGCTDGESCIPLPMHPYFLLNLCSVRFSSALNLHLFGSKSYSLRITASTVISPCLIRLWRLWDANAQLTASPRLPDSSGWGRRRIRRRRSSSLSVSYCHSSNL